MESANMPPVTKTAQVLKYFAQQYGTKGIPRKRLVKAAYMTDVLARQYLGRAITDLAYIKDHYGPNARELPTYTRELVASELADEVRERDESISFIRLKDRGRAAVFEFTLGELEILGYVAKNYLDMDISEFIDDVVKESDPFKAVEREGELLPMERLDNTKRRELGFDLERVVSAERDAKEGKYLTLATFADAIRAQITARRPS